MTARHQQRRRPRQPAAGTLKGKENPKKTQKGQSLARRLKKTKFVHVVHLHLRENIGGSYVRDSARFLFLLLFCSPFPNAQNFILLILVLSCLCCTIGASGDSFCPAVEDTDAPKQQLKGALVKPASWSRAGLLSLTGCPNTFLQNKNSCSLCGPTSLLNKDLRSPQEMALLPVQTS